jgi:hypothetical protein
MPVPFRSGDADLQFLVESIQLLNFSAILLIILLIATVSDRLCEEMMQVVEIHVHLILERGLRYPQ